MKTLWQVPVFMEANIFLPVALFGFSCFVMWRQLTKTYAFTTEGGHIFDDMM
jgi:hypothetical protein